MTLNFPLNKNTADFSGLEAMHDPNHDFSKAIKLFLSQREKLGISIEELSNKTRISKNVLIAIESGKEEYLPEKTYLISMLKRLEIELKLEVGSLNALLCQKDIVNNLSKFKFINIDLLNSWIGSLLYFIFMLLSILALNSQQKYLIKINSISTEPVRINETNKTTENIIKNQK